MFTACLLLVSLLALSPPPVRAQGESGEPSPREDRFFVVVLEAAERAVYEFLSEEEKAVFRRTHWGRLDPTPASEENERETEHQRRVLETIKRFRDRSGRFVWDDRGKALIRFGRPGRIEFVRGTLQDDRFVPPRELWLHGGVLLEFEDRDLSGTYRFGGAGGVFPVTEEIRRRLDTGEGFVWEVMGEEAADSARALALANLSLDPERDFDASSAGREWWEGVPERNEHAPPPAGLAFEQWVCALAREDSLACLLVGVEIPCRSLGRAIEVDAGRSSMRIELRTALRDSTYSLVARGRKNISCEIDPGGETPSRLIVVDSIAPSPGSYHLVIAVEDLAGGKGGIFQTDLDVPDLTGGSLCMSGLLLAEKAATSFREKGLVRRGDYRIDPRPSGSFRKGEVVHVYFEVYGVGPDRDGRYYSETAYSLSGKRPGGFSARFGGTEKGRLSAGDATKAGSVSRESSSVHLMAIETSDLPPDTYTLAVETRDLSSGETARAVGRFVVEE
ncbi:MAG: GWxTD domain-containing protein [Candidatus Eisenbacteria bacterium]